MDEARQVANVSNRLEVSHRRKELVKYVNVSTTLFQIMLALYVPIESEVTLFLDTDGPRMLFGILIDEDQLIDLWHYTMDQVPHVLLS